MFFQGARQSKYFQTNITFIGPFSCVCPHVLLPLMFKLKAFVTNITCKRPFSCVCPDVVIKIVRPSKPFIADITLVRLFTCVCPHVSLQVERFRKTLIANVTHVKLVFPLASCFHSGCSLGHYICVRTVSWGLTGGRQRSMFQQGRCLGSRWSALLQLTWRTWRWLLLLDKN